MRQACTKFLIVWLWAGLVVCTSIYARATPRRNVNHGAERPTAFAYVANAGSGTISQYRIRANGTLLPLQPPLVKSGKGSGRGVVISPSGRFAYLVNDGTTIKSVGSISQYRINNNGTLTPLAPPSILAGRGFVKNLIFSQDDRFAYLANGSDNTISQFQVNEDGTLSSLTPPKVATDPGPTDVFLHPNGRFAYSTNAGATEAGGTISTYAVNPDGTLAHLGVSLPMDGSSRQMTFDLKGSHVYVCNWATTNDKPGSVSQYLVGDDGTIKALSPASVPAGFAPIGFQINREGRFGYLTDGGDRAYQFGIGPDGRLVPLIPPSVMTGESATPIELNPNDMSAYVSSFRDGAVYQYKVKEDGRLASLAPALVPTGEGPQAVTVDPTGQFAYVCNSRESSISQYRIVTGGTLKPLVPATIPSGDVPDFVTITSIPPSRTKPRNSP